MLNIFLTGSTGFVGRNFLKLYKESFKIRCWSRGQKFNIDSEIIIHFAGKAHDLKNNSNPEEYYESNTNLTIKLFDSFLKSNSKIFIMLSSVKAQSDNPVKILTESDIPNPRTHYGISKLRAEEYILSKKIPSNKRFYIVRPSLIYGYPLKGNLSLLYKYIRNGYPWIFSAFSNSRSYCSVNNLLFLINELLINKSVPSGIYNFADNSPISTNEIVKLIRKINGQRGISDLYVPRFIIKFISKAGDYLNLPLNSEKLSKLTENYIVSNRKIMKFIDKPLPEDTNDGLTRVFKYLKNKII